MLKRSVMVSLKGIVPSPYYATLESLILNLIRLIHNNKSYYSRLLHGCAEVDAS